jgi:hypothetical protein
MTLIPSLRKISSKAALNLLSSSWTSTQRDLELVQQHASGDLPVLVAVERQHGPVGGLLD